MKHNPHVPTLYLSVALGWLLFLPYAKIDGPMKLTPEDAARYFIDDINFYIIT